MRNFTKNLIAASVLGTTALGSTVAMAELTGNIGVNSNYIWRGVSQTNDAAAVSGGLDYSNESGFYVGTWVSNLEHSQYELDLYGGFAGEISNVGYDVGVIHYAYPVGDAESDFTEVYGSATFGPVTAGVAYTFSYEWDGDGNDLYAYLGGDFELKEGLGLGLLVGSYNFEDDAADDYTHFQVSLSKDDFTFAIDQNNLDDTGAGEDDMRVSVAWSKSFDL